MSDTLETSRTSHKHRLFKVKTTLGEDILVFRRMTGTEQLGRLYEFELEMLSEDIGLDLTALLGQKLVVTMVGGPEGTGHGADRYYSGHVTRITQVGTLGRYFVYRATLRPWLWFLTRGAKNRIFEKISVPDILKKIFREYGFSMFEESLSGEHQVWEYRVQYRETDFDFVSRLMEEEGIYYFFKQEENDHKLVLADSVSAQPSCGTVPYFPPDEHGRRERDHIAYWAIAQEVQPGVYSTRDFNFAKATATLEGSSNAPNARSNAHGNSTFHDFTTELFVEGKEPKDRRLPDQLARVRIEEFQAQFEELQGAGDLAQIHAGVTFKMDSFPREDQNREYTVTGARFELVENEYETGISDDPSPPYTCSFTAIDRKDQFRSRRITPKSVVQGPHTAIVTGGGEGGGGNNEIWTDKYGRVRVKFHWERDGASSCWVRVSQAWAGKNWGAMVIPRVGQEVVVEFLEGDPDRPIITGRVYNSDQTVPYPLPAQATKTTFKSNSSVGGGGFNEWRFEDKKGSEEIFIHAQKDMNTIVLNDKTENVGHDRTREVGNDETVTIGHDSSRDVINNDSLIVGVDRMHDVGSNETITIGAVQDISVGSDQKLVVGGNQQIDVNAAITTKAMTEIKFVCGASSLVMKADGTINLKGMNVTVEGSMNNTMKAGMQALMKGGMTATVDGGIAAKLKGGVMASAEGAIVKVAGSALSQVDGGIVMIK